MNAASCEVGQRYEAMRAHVWANCPVELPKDPKRRRAVEERRQAAEEARRERLRLFPVVNLSEYPNRHTLAGLHDSSLDAPLLPWSGPREDVPGLAIAREWEGRSDISFEDLLCSLQTPTVRLVAVLSEVHGDPMLDAEDLLVGPATAEELRRETDHHRERYGGMKACAQLTRIAVDARVPVGLVYVRAEGDRVPQAMARLFARLFADASAESRERMNPEERAEQERREQEAHRAEVAAWLAANDEEPAPEVKGEPAPENHLLPHLRPLTLADLLTEPEPQRFLWTGRVPEAAYSGFLAGTPGAGKTTLAVALIVARAAGKTEFLGSPLKPGRSVFVSSEEGRDSVRRRIACLRRDDPALDVSKVAANCAFLCEPGLALKPSVADGRSYAVDRGFVQQLADAITERMPGADLVVMETLSRMAVDESNEGYRAFVEATDLLARLTGAVVLTLAHTSQASQSSGEDGMTSLRGGTSAPSNGRFVLTLTPFEANKAAQKMHPNIPSGVARSMAVLHTAKMNDGAPVDRLVLLKRSHVDLGITLHPFDENALGDDIERARKRESQVASQNRAATGLRLRTLVSRLIQEGASVSKRSLRERTKELGLSQDALVKAVEQAVADGYLDANGPKHGGHPTLQPGPRTSTGPELLS